MADLRQDSIERVLSIIKSSFEDRLEVKQLIQERLNSIVDEKKKNLYNDLSKLLQ